MNPPTTAPELTSEDLVQRVESGVPVRLLDIRANNSNRIDIVPGDRYVNIRGSQIMAMRDGIRDLLQPDGPVAVVCERGNSSKQIAVYLNRLGYQAESLRGGMDAWGVAVLARPLTPPAGCEHFVQFDRIAKGATGYLIGSRGQGVIVDPPRKAQPYLEAAKERGITVVAVADTHAHADYISGGPGLSRGLGVPYYLHPHDAILPYDGSPARVAFQGAEEGTEIRFGDAALRVAHNPGHTEGSVSYLVGDVAMTGDFIFVNSIGRPDLGGKAAEWTKKLWLSLERARREWKDETRIYPGHYATDAEREPDRSVGRALGAIRERNEPLRFADEASFTAWVMSKVGASPETYRRIKAVNLGLVEVWDQEAQELDCGKNECALG